MLKNNRPLPTWLTISLLSLFIIITALSLWWFQQANIKAFIDREDDSRFFQTHIIDEILQPYLKNSAPAINKQQTLLHFWRPDCLCNRVSQRHLDIILNTFKKDELKVIVIAHPLSTDKEISDLTRLNKGRIEVIRAEPELSILPSSPSLAIYNSENKLTYFGAYGFGAFCTVREDNFLSSLIKKNQLGEKTSFSNVIGDGCFCSWQ